jgi:uncharacterized repeat protein (TIGR01451 family)
MLHIKNPFPFLSRSILSLILLLLCGSLIAQYDNHLWIPVGEGIPLPGEDNFYEGISSTASADHLYVSITLPPWDNEPSRVFRWDGNVWTQLPILRLSGFFPRVIDIEFFNGQLYVAGDFEGLLGIPNTAGIVRFNGAGWVPVGGGISGTGGAIYIMTVYKGKLICGGDFSEISGVAADNIASWDGTTWSGLAGGIPGGTVENMIQDDSLLYAAGFFSNAGGVPLTENIASWDGTNWAPLDSGLNFGPGCLGVFNDELIVFGNNLTMAGSLPISDGFARWDGTEWFDLPLPSSTFGWANSMGATIIYNNKLWMAGSVGSTTGPESFMSWDGSELDLIPQSYIPGGQPSSLEIYDGELYVIGGLGTSTAGKQTEIYQWCDLGNCGRIEGLVFKDVDQDFNYTAGTDIPLSNRKIRIDPQMQPVLTDTNGYFGLPLEAGQSYDVIHEPELYWSILNPAAGYSFTLNPGQTEDSLYFATTLDTTKKDAQAQIFGGNVAGVARGNTIAFDFHLLTGGPIPALLTITQPAVGLNITPTPPADSINGPNMYWEVSDWPSDDHQTISLYFEFDPPITTGGSICWQATVDVGSGDETPANNTAVMCQTVVTSYDPNEKGVEPTGTGPQGYILVSDSILSYTIQFQNTGTDTAYNIVILDTLDANLDPSSLLVTGATHPFSYQVRNGKVIEFRFDNILLPDSNVNEPHSHGLVQYRIGLASGLMQGAEIRNTAHIYFDFNPAVATNTTLNTMGPATGLEAEFEWAKGFRLYPNPANEYFILEIREGLFTNGMRFQMWDLLGREVYSSGLSSSLSTHYPGRLAAGLYAFGILHDKQLIHTGKILIR